MTVPWFALMKIVPWTEVITHAPAVVSGAKKLWQSVAGGSAAPEMPPTLSPASTPGDRLAALETELGALRRSAVELHQQMLASSELIQDLARQNAALVQRMEAYRLRLRWLSGGMGLLLLLYLAEALLG